MVLPRPSDFLACLNLNNQTALGKHPEYGGFGLTGTGGRPTSRRQIGLAPARRCPMGLRVALGLAAGLFAGVGLLPAPPAPPVDDAEWRAVTEAQHWFVKDRSALIWTDGG